MLRQSQRSRVRGASPATCSATLLHRWWTAGSLMLQLPLVASPLVEYGDGPVFAVAASAWALGVPLRLVVVYHVTLAGENKRQPNALRLPQLRQPRICSQQLLVG